MTGDKSPSIEARPAVDEAARIAEERFQKEKPILAVGAGLILIGFTGIIAYVGEDAYKNNFALPPATLKNLERIKDPEFWFPDAPIAGLLIALTIGSVVAWETIQKLRTRVHSSEKKF